MNGRTRILNAAKCEKTALVLSAGGMFGAYQAGAYEAIAERFKVDMVVGASVGALNGWPIASGCTPQHLIDRWLDPRTGNSLQLFPNAGLRNGWFNPKPLRALATDLYENYTPRVPFGLVMVQVPSLRTHLVQYPDIRPEHLQATCSIPYFLPSVEIERRRYLDGGLFNKLPIQAALDMGATRLIAIDSLPEVGPGWIKMGIEVARFFKPDLKRNPRVPQTISLTVISAPRDIGTANDAVFWKEDNIRRYIRLGREDALRTLDGMAREPVPTPSSMASFV